MYNRELNHQPSSPLRPKRPAQRNLQSQLFLPKMLPDENNLFFVLKVCWAGSKAVNQVQFEASARTKLHISIIKEMIVRQLFQLYIVDNLIKALRSLFTTVKL